MTTHVHAKRKLVLSEVVCYGGAFNVKACPITKIMPSSTHCHCIALDTFRALRVGSPFSQAKPLYSRWPHWETLATALGDGSW